MLFGLGKKLEMEDPKVTIIIACYNDEEYIEKAINSAMKQNYGGPLTVCVINDGSTDGSWDLIAPTGEGVEKDTFDGEDVLIAYPDKNPSGISRKQFAPFPDRKFVIINRKNGGPSAARNTGIRYTLENTDIYAVLDADDEMYPDKIQRCVSVMKKDMSSIGVVYADYDTHHTATNKTIREFKEPYSRRRLLEECMVHSGSIINKQALIEVEENTGFYDSTMRTCEDYDLWMRISEKYVIAHVAEALTLVRVTGDNSSFIVNQDVWKRNWSRVMEKLQQRANAK